MTTQRTVLRTTTYRYRYRGWEVYDNGPDHHPITGRWQAWRYGVRIGHPTEAGLRTMIEQRGSGR